MRASYFNSYLQFLPLGAFRHVDVVVNGSDNLWGRAYQGDMAFLAGKPFVDAGFQGERLQVGVFVPGNPDKDACWRCLYPDINPGVREYSCQWYAMKAEEQGLVPAVQAVAQVAGAMQAEHTILALHGEFPLRNTVFKLNIRTGEAMRFQVSRDPKCPSVWHRVGAMEPVPIPSADEMTWGELLAASEKLLGGEVRLGPLTRLIWNMPCRSCRRFIKVRASAWIFEAIPYCIGCGGPFFLLPSEEAELVAEEWYDFVDFTTPDALGRRLADFGLYPGDLVIAEKDASVEKALILLEGDIAKVVGRFFTEASTDSTNTSLSLAQGSRAPLAGGVRTNTEV